MDPRRSDKNEPRDPVSPASHTRDPEFQVRRLARVLVGRLDQTSNVLSGDASASQIMIDSPARRAVSVTREDMYAIGQNCHDPFIQCMVCMRTSYDPNDIAELYGGFCHSFHESAERSQQVPE